MIVTFNHVSKSYDRKWKALSDIHFRIENGEFVFLTGPSGAGKTTILKLIYMEERPDSGEVLVSYNRDLTYRSGSTPVSQVQALRRKLGIVFQDFKLMHDRNVFENVAFALRVTGRSNRSIKKRVFEVLSTCGVAHKALHFPLQLSGGEQQRVSIARALANEPYIILADEPTGNLDMETARDVMAIFRGANASGTAIVMATHNTSLIETLPYRKLEVVRGMLVKRDFI